MINYKSRHFANGMLIIVTLVWGAAFPLLKDSLAHLLAVQVLTLRFGLSTVLLLPFVIFKLKHSGLRLLAYGALLGIFNFLSCQLEVWAMNSEPTSDAAFISAMCVIFVPFLMPILGLGRARKVDCWSIVLAIIGMIILGGLGSHLFSLTYLALFASALCFAVNIVCLQWMRQKTDQTFVLTFYQLLTIFCLAWGFSGCAIPWHHIDKLTMFAIFWCALLATCFGFTAQIYFQRFTTPTQTGLIFSLEPWFATIIAYFFNGEPLYLHTVFGGLLIFLAVIVPMFFSYKER